MEKTKVFFPYDKNGVLISLEKIKQKNPTIFELLQKNKKRLLNRSLQDQKWYEFARTQGIADTNKKRIAIGNIVKNINSIKINKIDSGIILYSGYYIYSEKYNYDDLIFLIKQNDFINFLKILGKDKNGEYYFYSSLDLKRYLSYKILEYFGGRNV